MAGLNEVMSVESPALCLPPSRSLSFAHGTTSRHRGILRGDPGWSRDSMTGLMKQVQLLKTFHEIRGGRSVLKHVRGSLIE